VLRSHSFVVIVPAVNLLELFLELEKFGVIRKRGDHIGHGESILYTILAINRLFTLVVIVLFQGLK
jgi:hypothetical protein